jgi:membrane protease YdiL (CAAX protease family)
MNTAVAVPTSVVPPIEARRRAAPFVPFHRISRRTAVWITFLAVGLITPLSVGIGLLHLPDTTSATAAMPGRWAGYLTHPGMLWLKAVLIVPLVEEVFYRGLLLQLLRRYTPTWCAVAITTAFFGATHIGSGSGTAANACVLGAIFAWLVIRTGSLVSSLLCHATINFTWLFVVTPTFGIWQRVLQTGDHGAFARLNPLTVFPAWWLVTSLALTVASAVMLRRSVTRAALA